MTKEQQKGAMEAMDAQWEEVRRRGYPRRRPPQGTGVTAGEGGAEPAAADGGRAENAVTRRTPGARGGPR